MENEFRVKQDQIAEDVRHITKSLDDLVKNFNNAFPSGDTDGHRRYHEAVIEDVEARKKLAQAIKEKTISGLIWAAILAAASAGWHEILRVIGK